jgi:hypothetical protein
MAGLAAAAVLAPAALANGAAAPASTPSAWCKQLRADAAAWAAFQAATPGAQGKTFAAHFGAGKALRNAMGRCVALRTKAVADARKAPQPAATEQPAASLEVAEACKAIVAGKQAPPAGTSYRNVGDCLRDNAGR